MRSRTKTAVLTLVLSLLVALTTAHADAPSGWKFKAGVKGKPAVLLIHGLAASRTHWTSVKKTRKKFKKAARALARAKDKCKEDLGPAWRLCDVMDAAEEALEVTRRSFKEEVSTHDRSCRCQSPRTSRRGTRA